MSDLFRKSAIEKLSSPEQLDKAIVITPPSFWIALIGGILIIVVTLVWGIWGRIPVKVETAGIYMSGNGTADVYSEVSGVVTEVIVESGDYVKKGQIIAYVDSRELPKEQGDFERYGIISTKEGEVQEVIIESGSVVSIGSELIKVKQGEVEQYEVVCYIPVAEGKKIKSGMEVMVYPTTVNTQEYGHMKGTVKSVSEYVISSSKMKRKLGDETLVQAFLNRGPVIEVICILEEDKSTASGYEWSSKKGADIELTEGTMITANIVTERKAPITMLIPYLKEKFTIQSKYALDLALYKNETFTRE